ncbi:MAG: hypothetical protein ACR2J8_01430 [Thermomicrobiales bacterium]
MTPWMRAALAAVVYVVLVFLSIKLFPTLPVVFLVALLGGPVALGAWTKTWTWVIFCPLAVALVVWLARSSGPAPVSVSAQPLIDGLAAGALAFLPAAVGAWFGASKR